MKTGLMISVGLGSWVWLAQAAWVVGGPSLDVVNVRGGLPNMSRMLVDSATAEQPVRIMYFGGGATKGEGASKGELCYRAQVSRELRNLYPKCKFAELDKSLVRSGSWLGAFRTETEINQHYLPLALVVIEFAADDLGAPEDRVTAALEGIVRQIRGRHKQADLLFVYAPRKEFVDAVAKGEAPDPVRWHEAVAERYGIASVNVAALAAEKIAAGEVKADELSADGLHPTDKGHALCAEAVKRLLQECRAATLPDKPVDYALPAPLSKRPMEKARLVSYEKAVLDDGWLGWQESPIPFFFHVVRCEQPGPVITLRFKGAAVGYFDALGPDSGDFEVSLDGAAWQAQRNFDTFAKAGSRPHPGLVAENLDPTATHELKLRIAAHTPDGSQGRWGRIAEFLVDGDVICDDPFRGLSALQRIDAIYAPMEPLKYDPPAERWQKIPKTMQKLQEGPALTIVMLGDSIVNDTAHSSYEELLMRLYPKCRVKKVVSVRGSTGCWWYKDEGRVKPYVLDHAPDLLMIGGISQRNDIESIRSVIQQARAALPDLEVLLMSEAFGSYDPRKDEKWTYDVDPQGDAYRSRLLRLATEENCEFVDMQGPWGRYIRESTRAMGSFKRDPVHANDRGKQILGRILERFFAPK